MSNHIKLVPDLQRLIDDFVSVRQRFADLADTYVKQKIQIQQQQIEIDQAKKEIFSLKQTQTDKNHLSKSYDQLKRDYDLLYSSFEKQKEEIRKQNDKHLRDLEEQLKEERVKLVEQAEMHKKNMTRVVSDYESKLRDTNEKLRRGLIRPRDDETPTKIGNIYDDSPASKNAKWPELPLVRSYPKPSASGRGRGGRGGRRGTGAKRKLFLSKNERPIDIV